MKNIFLTLAATAISVITVGNANAQFALSDSDHYYINPCAETIYITPNPAGKDHNNDHSKEINTRATNHFHKEFPKVSNEHWYKAGDGGYIASFDDHSSQTKVAYDQKGRLHHTISYYDEKTLPRDIWEAVKSSYYAYEIFRIAEVHFNNQTVYMVYMQDETNLKTVRVSDGIIEEVQNLKKG